MKTIEEAAKEYAHNHFEQCKYTNCTNDKRLTDVDKINDAFKAGAEYAQRWISVEDEPMIDEGQFLVKVNNGSVYLVWGNKNDLLLYIPYSKRRGVVYKDIVTHWRKIEL